MYARLVTMSGADAGKREAALEMINGTVIPTLRDYSGFKGYIALWDKEKEDAKAILLWDDEASAESAEETLRERRVQFAGDSWPLRRLGRLVRDTGLPHGVTQTSRFARRRCRRLAQASMISSQRPDGNGGAHAPPELLGRRAVG